MTLKRNLGLVAAVLLLAAFAPARASDRDETEVTVQVSVADHALAEGYLSLGDSATMMVTPGSDLYASWPVSAATE